MEDSIACVIPDISIGEESVPEKEPESEDEVSPEFEPDSEVGSGLEYTSESSISKLVVDSPSKFDLSSFENLM